MCVCLTAKPTPRHYYPAFQTVTSAPTLFNSLKSSFPDVFPSVAIHVASLKTQKTG
jgi:hypothetical protein